MTIATPRYGFYLGSSATGHRYASRAHLTRAMREDPTISQMPVHEVCRSGRRIDHPKAGALDASNNPQYVVPDVEID